MINPNDILIRETSNGHTVWVSQRLVVVACGINEEHLRTVCRDRYKQSLPVSWRSVTEQPDFFLGLKPGKSWRWGRKYGQFYYDVDTIPNRAPVYYRDCLPTKEELIALVDENRMRNSRDRELQIQAKIKDTAAQFITEEDARWIQVVSGISVSVATARDYARALGWCRFITMIARADSYTAFGIATKGEFYNTCAEILEKFRIANLRVSTGPSLRKKLISFPDDVADQRRWIISEKYGNDNRKIVGKKYQIVDVTTGELKQFDLHQAVMYSAYMNIGDPRKEYKETLYNEVYVPMMEEFGVDPVALRTFNSHLTRFSERLKLDLHRHGLDYYKKHMLTYIPAERLSYAHSLFCGDGSGLVGYRYWKKSVKDKKPQYELRIMNLYAVLVSDVATGYIAGYAFSPEGTHMETDEMVQNAVRMAVSEGGNQTMFEFVSDNFGAFTKGGQKEFLRSVFNVVRTIEPGNSQGNPAEMQFRLFKNSTLRSMRNFIRSSHNVSSIEGQANIEDMRKEDYPEYSEAIRQVEEAIYRWNNTPRGNDKTPAEMFHGNKHPECKPIPAIQMRTIMGHHTRVEVTRMRGFVNVSHGGTDYQFTIPDFHGTGARKISAATGNGYDAQVYVTFDENGADLYSSDGKYILTCEPTVGAGKAYIERTAEQLEARRELSKRKDSQLEHAEAFGAEVTDAMSVLVSGNGYAADVHFGGGKDSTNAVYEDEVNTKISQAEAAKNLIKRQAKERRAIEREKAKEVKALEEAALIYKRNRISDISKYK